jgi:hypothetical protein
MNQRELEKLLMIEVHRLVVRAAHEAVDKLGKPVPAEARSDYLSPAEVATLKSGGLADPDNSIANKALASSAAKVRVLSFPLDGEIIQRDAAALESLQMADDQRSVLERIVAEACHTVFFHFFCLLDSVADPELTPVKNWNGARFVAPRKEGPMLHDEIAEMFWEYRKRLKH